MTELDYVLSRFERQFSSFRGKRILLHGSREYAEGIIRAFHAEYGFIGVSTFDELPGEEYCSVPLVPADRIREARPDLIILTERVRHAEEAWLSLRGLCEESGVAIRNMYGVDEAAAHADYEASRFLTVNRLRMIADEHEAVMFELINGFFAPLGDALEPDPHMLRLCRYAFAEGKTVLFSVRKSFPAERQLESLRSVFEQEAFPGRAEDHLVYREGEDLSFRRVAERYPEGAVCYLCRGLVNEFLLPRAYGIHTFRVTDFGSDGPYRTLAETPEGYRFEERISREEALERALSYDAVSFDVFDTLIGRKVLFPADIFELTEKEAIRAIGPAAAGLCEHRIRVSQTAPRASIRAWYEEIGRAMGLDPDTAERLMRLEIDTEKKYLYAREPVVRLMEDLRRAGKPVFLVSDMYLPADEMTALLSGLGVTGYDRLFISCDHDMFKSEGLFRSVLAAAGPGASVLHIGDDACSDGRAADREGMDYLLLPAPLRMARDAGWKTVVETAETLTDRCLLGACTASCFPDPFRSADLRSLPREERLAFFSRAVCAPVLLGYLFDLTAALKEERFDKVLFSARDGYLLTDAYRTLRARARGTETGSAGSDAHTDGPDADESPLPDAVYFYCSRHSAFLTCADDPGLVSLAADSLPSLSPEELLRNVLELDVPQSDRSDGEEHAPDDEADRERLAELFEAYLPQLREIAARNREYYGKYLEKAGIARDGRYALMDFVSAGNTQRFLTEGLGLDLTGFFVGRPLYGRKLHADLPRRYYLTGRYNDAFQLYNNYMEMEYIMTSPEPSVDRFDRNGDPVFAEETRTPEQLAEIGRMQDAIRAFMAEFLDLCPEDGLAISPAVLEELFDAAGVQGILTKGYDDWSKKDIERS